MSAAENQTARTRVDVRVEAAKAPRIEVGTQWRVVASAPASLWEGDYTVTLERIETDSDGG
jgi:hypothetical protein